MHRIVIIFFLGLGLISCGKAGTPAPSGAVKVRSAVLPALTDPHYTNSQESFSVQTDVTDDRIKAVIPNIDYTADDELTITIAPNAHMVFQRGEQTGPTVYIRISTLLEDPNPQITIKNDEEEQIYTIELSRYDSIMATDRNLPADATPVYGQDNFSYITTKPMRNYILVNDLTLQGEHTPIAPETNNTNSDSFDGIPFSGIFEGNHKTIRGLRIIIDENDPDRNEFLGLFGKIDGGTVRNLRILEPIIQVQKIVNEAQHGIGPPTPKDAWYVGAVAGELSGTGTIERVAAIDGSFSASDTNTFLYFTGGLVGHHHGGVIRNSHASVAIAGENNLGGLVGILGLGHIESSYAIGQVFKINAGSTSNTDNGGFLGYYFSYTSDRITNSYFDAVLSGQERGIGSFYGSNRSTVEAFYTNADDGFVYTDENYAPDEMISTSNFPGWDFTDIWEMNPGEWPTLR